LSGAHLALVPRIREMMDANGLNDVPLLVGGIIPDDDKPTLAAIGVDGVFGPGTNTDHIVAYINNLMASKGANSAP
jgi:methylmalonyl-CoA mutase C-terminal domain/subunit